MELRSCVRYLFLLFLTLAVLWTAPAFAGKHICHIPTSNPGGGPCYCEGEGANEHVVSCDDNVPNTDTIPAEQGKKTNDDCETVTDYEREFTDKCFTCSLFANLMGAVQAISKGSFEATSDALIELLCIAFLIYIGYRTLLTVASPEAQKLSKYLTELLIQGLKVAITILILQHPSFLYNKLLSPILESSVDFGMSLTGTNAQKAAETGAKYTSYFDTSNEYFSARTAQIMVGAVENFSNGATTMPAIGRGFICNSFKDLEWFFRMKVIPRVGMFTEGALLYISGVGIWLAIGFYMLDCAIELGIVCALMAFFVACWPFKLTSGYTKIGWNMFLNVFFNFVMMGIIVATIVGISGQALSVGTSQEILINLINSDSIESLEDTIQIGGLQMLMVIACCFMCFKLPREASNLASKFAAGAQLGGLGGNLGGTAAGLVTHAAIGDALSSKGKQPGEIGGLAGLTLKGIKGTASGLKSAGDDIGATGAVKAGASKVKNTAKNIKNEVFDSAKAALGMDTSDKNSQQQDEITNGFKQDTDKNTDKDK